MDQGRIQTDPLPMYVPSQWDNDVIHQVDTSHTHTDAAPSLCFYMSDIHPYNYLSCSLRNWVKCSFRIQDAEHLVNPKKGNLFLRSSCSLRERIGINRHVKSSNSMSTPQAINSNMPTTVVCNLVQFDVLNTKNMTTTPLLPPYVGCRARWQPKSKRKARKKPLRKSIEFCSYQKIENFSAPSFSLRRTKPQ